MLKQALVQRALQVSALALMGLTAACGVSNASPAGSTADASSNTAAVVTPTPTPTPTTTSAAAGPVVSPNGLVGEAAVADNFDGTPGIVPEQGPPIISAELIGAFRMFCTAGQLLKDDPIVYPGQHNVGHLHQFFGNTGANGDSNYQSLRTSGGTTCGQSATPFNRSAYWFPAMLDGTGNVIKPDFISLYYKRNSASDPMCSVSSAEHLGQCVDLPNGIRFVFGFNMKTMSVGTDPVVNFSCWDSEDGTVSRGPATGVYQSIAAVAAAGCPVGAQLVITPNAPNCWDGIHLDSADHRSHMAYATGPYYQGQMWRACPADHPYVIPNMETLIHFTVDANLAKWHVSSDEMVAGAANGSTFHVDYWEAWSPTIKANWHQHCIDLHMSCSNGGLGDGTEIKGAGVPWGGFPKHQLVPVPN